MSQTDLSSRPLVTLGYLLRRVALAAAVIGASVLLLSPRRAGLSALHFHMILPHLHAARFDQVLAAPAVIRLHLAAALTAFVVGSVLLAGVKGTALHKALGWTWVAAMGATAVSSLFIRVINPGHWSYIHFLSGWVIIALPMAVVAIKRGDVRLHRRLMTGLFVGGLAIAGAFTFAPTRLMGSIFFG